MRRILAVTVLSVAMAACAPSTRETVSEEWRYGPIPTCATTSRGRLLLMAQSVPDAALVPCIERLVGGWEMTGADSRSGESVLVFTTDSFDLDVRVVLTPQCDLAGTEQLDSPRAGTELFVGEDGATRSFVFDGGCIAFEYDTPQLARSLEGVELLDAIRFMPRGVLAELSGWTL